MYFIREKKDTIKIATYPLQVFTHIHKHIHVETHIYAFNKYTPKHAHGRIHTSFSLVCNVLVAFSSLEQKED